MRGRTAVAQRCRFEWYQGRFGRGKRLRWKTHKYCKFALLFSIRVIAIIVIRNKYSISLVLLERCSQTMVWFKLFGPHSLDFKLRRKFIKLSIDQIKIVKFWNNSWTDSANFVTFVTVNNEQWISRLLVWSGVLRGPLRFC